MTEITNNKRVLDLSGLFEDDKKIKVLAPTEDGAREFDLLSPRDIGPKTFVKLEKMLKKAARFQDAAEEVEDMTEKQAEELERIFDEAIAILSKDLADLKLPFVAKYRIITFYNEEVKDMPLLGEADPKVAGPESAPKPGT